MFILILCTIILGLLFLKKFQDDKKYADYYKIPGPKTLPLLGNALLFGLSPKSRDVFATQLKLAETYGDFFRLVMGPEKAVVLGRPEHLEIVLGSTRLTRKSENYNMWSDWLGTGLIITNGDIWRKHRKIITPTFHFKCLQDYATFMAKNLKVLMTILKQKASTQNIIDIEKYIKLYALDTICDSAMRYELNAQGSKEQESYVRALKGYLEIDMQRYFSILLRIDFVYNRTKLCREQNRHIDTMRTFTNEVIDFRKKERITNITSNTNSDNDQNVNGTEENEFDKPKKSFLDYLLDKQHENGLTDAEISDEVTTFLFGGHDTVTSSISFCLYELSKHPEVQDALVEESLEIMPKGKEIEVNCSNISSLKYLDCVVKECMRMYTTVPFVERQIEEDVTLDGLKLPAGTVVQIWIYTMHHNPKYYPEPEKFDPDRFNPDNTKERHSYAYIPFSAGPRNCIGYKYGQLMTKATLINILRNFKVSRPKDAKYEPVLCNNVILQSSTGINIILEERD